MTDKPLRKAMSSPKAVGRMALWAIELSEFDVWYQPRIAVKGQVIADFIAEFTVTEDQGAKEAPIWSIHIDGSSNKHAGGASMVLCTLEGDKIECMICLKFSITNNEAEYEALITGVDLAIAAGASSMIVYSDSQIVTSQVNGSYECKNERMKRYLEEVKGRMSNVQIKLGQIPREENQHDYRLAKVDFAEPMIIPDQVLSFVQLASLIDGTSVQDVHDEHCSMTLVAAYLTDEKLLDDKEAARKTTARTPTGETPFRLAYGSEAVIPTEVGLTSYRVENHDKNKNDEAISLHLDLVDEVKVTAEQRLARYQNLMAKHYNSKVKHRDFQVRDFVLRRVIGTARDASQGKLGPNWEGPYRITSFHRKGTYHLKTLEEQKLSHPWNTKYLKKYYQ
ncbi:uncharacterized protein LOC142620220 [Castanea sativa]|uniref:uncharacterized protein LOC142620220 n=1 Tax=Castanea sativa TaxID=21020 RepID=UPI003F64C88A